MLKLREADIKKTCCDYLELDGWRILHCEPVSRREWGRGFGEVGMADTLAIRYAAPVDCRCFLDTEEAEAEVLWIEWKSLRGKPSAKQQAWHKAERARGALTLIAGEDFPATIEGFLAWYQGSGLNCGKV